MEQHRQADSRGELSIEDAVRVAYERSWAVLPDDFPDDLKRLAFEKVLEHTLELVREKDRREFDLELERLRMESRAQADKFFFGLVEKCFDTVLEIEKNTGPKAIPIPVFPVKDEDPDG